jgi:tRNA(Ile)-lysidine synthase TilS/MesJ
MAYGLLADGDRILVAMSGGKDSYGMFYLLDRLVRRLPFRVELFAVHLDQVQPGYDGRGLAGKLQAMPAIFTTDDGRLQVIRPLIECAEADLASLAEIHAFPIIPCNLCGSQDGLKRDAMSALIANLEKEDPRVRQVMLNALRNVRPSHLLDRDVARAWAERDPAIRPT